MDLVPRPDIAGANGVAELGRAESPFDVAVSPEGHQRYDVTATLTGLPDPASLGPFTTYVAWVSPPSLEPMLKLGPVRNGRFHLGEVEFDKFILFVSAEPAETVSTRTGRLVLRGMSPSIRMQQHSMMILTRSGDSAHSAQHAGHAQHGGQNGSGPAWLMPPIRPGVPMLAMPGVDALVPPATPFLPGAGVDPYAVVHPRS